MEIIVHLELCGIWNLVTFKIATDLKVYQVSRYHKMTSERLAVFFT